MPLSSSSRFDEIYFNDADVTSGGGGFGFTKSQR
jgi:hypothetical protein